MLGVRCALFGRIRPVANLMFNVKAILRSRMSFPDFFFVEASEIATHSFCMHFVVAFGLGALVFALAGMVVLAPSSR